MLALGTGQGFVELIDPATGQTRARTKPHNFDVTALQVMWDMSAGRVARIARQNLPPSDFTDCCGRARQLSPCGRLVASGGRDGVVKVWVAENGLEQWRLQAHDGRDGCLCELFDPLSNPEEVEMATDIFSNTQELLRLRSRLAPLSLFRVGSMHRQTLCAPTHELCRLAGIAVLA